MKTLVKLNSNIGAFSVFSDYFTDVTLVSDDMQKYAAHRIILSNYSPVLQNLLLSGPIFDNAHTILHVRGFSGEQLQTLLEFIYKGQLQIEDAKVLEFMRLAEELKLSIIANDNVVSSQEKETVNVNKIKEDYGILNTSNITLVVSKNETNLNYNEQGPTFMTETWESDESENQNESLPGKSETKITDNEKSSISMTVTLETEECKVVTAEKIQMWKALDTVLERNYECHLCDSRIKSRTKSSLKQHYQNYHKSNISTNHFDCKKCQKVFTEQKLLKNHFETVHMKDQHRYQCVKCEFKSFSTREQQSHYRNFHAEAKYACHSCSLVYRNGGHLKYHRQRVHNELGALKKEKCDQCGKQYTKTELKKHIEMVHEGKKYPCSFCPYKASCPRYLLNHEAIHNGVEFPCNQCDYKGKLKQSLRTHIKVEHENLRFYCDQCTLITRSKSQLRKHKGKKHK